MENFISSTHVTYPSLDRVSLGNDFIGQVTKKIHTVSAYDILNKFEESGALENYRRVARKEEGGHAGPPWFHGLICECIRGISDILVTNYSAQLDAKLDEIIDLIASAQAASEENYINPYTTLMCPHQRWGRNGGNIRFLHETYNAGCLVEAGVHHYKATGKTSLLQVAVKMANFLADFVGDAPRHNVVAEHSLPEEALLKLYRLFKDDPSLTVALEARPEEYHRVARFFVDHKGDNETRHNYPKFLQEYAQDHRPAKEQREAVGHAVRATLLYTGMTALALEDRDEELAKACRAIWKDISETKLHINGSVGAHRYDERFGHQYVLPNHAYLETCAGVGLVFFGSEIFRLLSDASVWDTVEMTLFNVIPAAVSADGVKYTYENPLESKGNFERWSWHECPCCPPMLLKLVGYLPSLIFAEDGDNVWLNLWVDATLRRNDCTLSFRDGRLTIHTTAPSVKLSLRIRIPYWTRDFSISERNYRIENGYAVIDGEFLDGDTVTLSYSTPIVKYIAHPLVEADLNRVAVKHGPILYCIEGIDNGCPETLDALEPCLAEKTPLTMNADGSISGKCNNGDTIRMIPYHTWNNRGACPMRVWLKQEGFETDVMASDAWQRELYRPYAEY